MFAAGPGNKATCTPDYKTLNGTKCSPKGPYGPYRPVNGLCDAEDVCKSPPQIPLPSISGRWTYSINAWEVILTVLNRGCSPCPWNAPHVFTVRAFLHLLTLPQNVFREGSSIIRDVHGTNICLQAMGRALNVPIPRKPKELSAGSRTKTSLVVIWMIHVSKPLTISRCRLYFECCFFQHLLWPVNVLQRRGNRLVHLLAFKPVCLECFCAVRISESFQPAECSSVLVLMVCCRRWQL